MIHVIPRIACRFAAAVLLSTFAIGVTPALAQEAAPPAQPQVVPVILGIVDTQTILNTSAAGKSLETQWNAAMKALNADVDKKEADFRAQVQALEATRESKPAEYATKRKALEQQGLTTQQTVTKTRKQWDDRLNKAREKIAAAAKKALTDEVAARKLTLVIDRSATPVFSPQWDITAGVMARLNKALPNVKL